jgi:hypothetical protein
MWWAFCASSMELLLPAKKNFMEKEKSSRYMLFIWGTSEIVLAISLAFVWQSETGVLSWIRTSIQALLTIFGLLCLKDGFFASDSDIIKKMRGGSRDNFELKTQNKFLNNLKKLENKHPLAFPILVVVFMILYFSNFYMPGKQILEILVAATGIIFSVPVLVFW